MMDDGMVGSMGLGVPVFEAPTQRMVSNVNGWLCYVDGIGGLFSFEDLIVSPSIFVSCLGYLSS